MTQKEKVLLLGALFHDVGKFQQRCGVKSTTKHQELGGEFVDEFKDEFLKIVKDDTSVQEIKNIIKDHHKKNADGLTQTCRTADHLSASERVGFDEEDDWKDKWSHKYLSSLFSKIYLNNKDGKEQRYYRHKVLTKDNYKILIPEFSDEKDLKEDRYNYRSTIWTDFTEQLKAVFNFYEEETDFSTFINLLLILFEKYMWCIPDFTGSANTDISLYNHLKDVAGISHAIHKSDKEGTNLNLIIGDLPGIQKYIFNVANKKPAKVLRGRSIFVQILTRQFATIILNEFGLTDANLIMLAGGKFYILAQDSNDFETKFNDAKDDIEHNLIENFNYQLSFSAAFETFDYKLLMGKDKDKRRTFGDVIDKASYKLLEKRNQQFENILFEKDDFDENQFVLTDKYIEPKEDADSNSIKCAVTDLPIREDHREEIEGEQVDKQVKNEYEIGSQTPKSNIIIEFDENNNVTEVKHIDDYKPNKDAKRILLNPNLDELLKKENMQKDILRNTQIIEVANYSTWHEEEGHVLEFDKIEDENNGAKYLTLIKGDVDNLGLIMSSGLVDDEDDYTAISRTTTLSNHLKYFFSFSLNGFLSDWNDGKIISEFDNTTEDQKVYTVFAGGDDLMLIAPQSSSLKLLYEFNKTFNDFVCDNPEVHISYSLTNFKHNTPIRIVADMAEENQEKIKGEFKDKDLIEKIDNEPNIFHTTKDKAGIRIFDTNLKNELIGKLLDNKKELIRWEKDDSNKVTQGVLRNLLYLSKIMKDFNEKEDTRLLMWHPKLNYMINRLLKKNETEYYNSEVETFFENALKINKKESKVAQQLGKILYPLVCETIYGTRNYKGE